MRNKNLHWQAHVDENNNTYYKAVGPHTTVASMFVYYWVLRQKIVGDKVVWYADHDSGLAVDYSDLGHWCTLSAAVTSTQALHDIALEEFLSVNDSGLEDIYRPPTQHKYTLNTLDKGDLYIEKNGTRIGPVGLLNVIQRLQECVDYQAAGYPETLDQLIFTQQTTEDINKHQRFLDQHKGYESTSKLESNEDSICRDLVAHINSMDLHDLTPFELKIRGDLVQSGWIAEVEACP